MKSFEGIRVLDLTHVLAGPFCTFQLACMGADVIKVESAKSSDMTRVEGVDPQHNRDLYGSYFQGQNAGKRGIAIDLKTPAGKEILWRLIDTADVLVQNYADNALDKLGFGYKAVSDVNPKIIYCSISGFGATGPKASHPAYDVVIQAFSGLMAANGEPDRDPVRVGPPMVDYGTGAQAAFAIASALYQRHQTQKGQFIDVSMLDSALMMMSALVIDTAVTGEAPIPHGNAHPSYAGYASYDTADGQLMLGAFTNKQLAALLQALGEPARAQEILKTDRQDIAASFTTDRDTIARHLLEKTADAWEELLNNAHVPAARVRSLDETLNEKQIKLRNGVQQITDNPAGSPGIVPVAGFSFAHGSPSVDTAAPKLGQHTSEVLTELGYSDEEITKLCGS